MTFIIVGGVAEFDFSRILRITDQLCDEGVLDGKTTKAQIGHCSYQPKNYESYRFVDGEKFHKDIEEANLIITHGGVGTLVSALKLGKKVIVFPRLSIYNEHLDNHQLDICKAFSEKRYCMMATNKEELKECIKRANEFIPNSFVTDNSKMTEILMKYIGSLQEKQK